MSGNWTNGPWMLEGRWEPQMQRLGGWLSFGSPETAHVPMFELMPIAGEPAEILAAARLIVAAPDMAKALEKALWMIQAHEGTSDEADAIYDDARAALAKARGEA